jgi:hypothetical protein
VQLEVEPTTTDPAPLDGVDRGISLLSAPDIVSGPPLCCRGARNFRTASALHDAGAGDGEDVVSVAADVRLGFGGAGEDVDSNFPLRRDGSRSTGGDGEDGVAKAVGFSDSDRGFIPFGFVIIPCRNGAW